MNYYIDTEFIEGFVSVPQKWFRERQMHTIDLISIGIVAEDGREYYAVSRDFDLKLAWNKYDLLGPAEFGGEPEKKYWLRDNVLKPLYVQLCSRISGDQKNFLPYWPEDFSFKNLKRLIYVFGKTNEQIAAEIQSFTANTVYLPEIGKENDVIKANRENPPVFYAYYADYDWVLFCSLFGTMMDLPDGYPMYCRDLKQILDELYEQIPVGQHGVTKPEQINEHYALADAWWNRKLHDNIKAYRAHRRIMREPLY